MGTSQMLTCASFGCYGGGGATQNLFSLKNETKELIHELKVGAVYGVLSLYYRIIIAGAAVGVARHPGGVCGFRGV